MYFFQQSSLQIELITPKNRKKKTMEDNPTPTTEETQGKDKLIWIGEMSMRACLVWSALASLIAIISLTIWYCFWVTFVDNYEYGFTYNRFTGKIEPLERTGWIVRNPWEYNVHTIDMRPYQVSVSANNRILNAKLVRFNPAGLQTFVEWHGRDAGDSTESLKEILKSYAFDTKNGADCPFLTISSNLALEQSPSKQ